MESHRRWADRPYAPIEAAEAAKQFLQFDPGYFLRQCDLAGLHVFTDGHVVHFSGDAENERVKFLLMWLRLSGGGKRLRRCLERRNMYSPPPEQHEAEPVVHANAA